jgi:ATP-binding cassette subfamily B protein IrtB
MMKDAPTIILDEAAANVNPESEKEQMDAISALTQEKTVIMIANRLRIVRRAGQILVVDKRRIVQRGIRDQLLAQDGIYSHFIRSREQAVDWKL